MSHLAQSIIGGTASGSVADNGILPVTGGFAAATTAGNHIVMMVYMKEVGASNGNAIASISIAGGYSRIFTAASLTNGFYDDPGTLTGGTAFLYYIDNAPAMSAANTVTVNGRNLSGFTVTLSVEFHLYEFTGVLVPLVRDLASGVNTSNHAGGTPTKAFTSTPNMNLMIAILTAEGGNLSPDVGYTLGINSTVSGVGQMQYNLGAAAGQTSASFVGSVTKWAMGVVAFKSDADDSGDVGGGGGGGDTGCGACSGPHLLQLIPGFSDLPDSVLQAEDPAFALHLGEIATNATFGMVRMEVFPCMQIHGDTVALPTSCLDGYKYSREELNYIWTVQNSTEHSTNWISGPDSLWFSNWNVNQVTGEVFSEEWYERSSSADTRLAAKSNDGLLMVFTIAQRQKTNMIMSAPAVYNSISESTIAIDKPYTQDLAQHLNQNAKFGCVNKEFFYLGEYVTGNTVVLPVSEVDGYTYTAAECEFIHTWRWTSLGTNYLQPPGSYEQAAPFQASVSAVGLVSITVTFSTSGGENVVTAPGYGRIAVFAFCTRGATPSSGTLANAFTELSLDYFAPGRTVRASELLTIKRNIDEAILSPEFFGPTDYADAATVPLPVSTVDGYVYARNEVQYIWSWSNVKNNSGGTHVRLPLFFGSVDPNTGKVTLRCWRLPPGGPYVDDSNVNARITVIVMAIRNSIHPIQTITQKVNANTPSDSGTAPIDNSIIQINGA